MPVVFVHGVATRQSSEYRAQVHQRDTLFKQLVLPRGSQVFDPDWGSNAVSFNRGLPWLPEPGRAEAFAVGANQTGGEIGIAKLATLNPDVAVDLAFEAGLAARAQSAAKSGNAADALSEKDLEAFESAVRYLEKGADKTAFDAQGTDAVFLSALASELKAYAKKGADAETMGLVGDALQWLGQSLKELVGSVSNVTSDAVLRLVRRGLSKQVALFLGDIFVYLRWRETDGAKGTANRIFGPIVTDLVKAATLRKKEDPLLVIGHSLGGVILYDLLSDPKVLADIKTKTGADLTVDALITAGSQPGLFADMALYPNPPAPGALRPRPAPVLLWLNVYDYTDVLSFSCKKIFKDVEDYEFDNVTGLFSAQRLLPATELL